MRVTQGTPEGTVFDQLAGVPVGSRVLFLLPATDAGPAVAVVLDIVAQPTG